MSWALVLPAVAAVALALFGGIVQRQLRPRAGALILTVLARIGISAAVAGALALVAVGLSRPSVVGGRERWMVPEPGSFPRGGVPPVGLAASAGLILMVVAVTRQARRWRRTVAVLAHDGPLEVLPTTADCLLVLEC